MNKQLQILLFIYFITGFSMFIIVFIRTYINKDLFTGRKTRIIDWPNCDLMCLSHFIMYTLLGYYSPKYWYISFILSIIWEYSEEYMEKHNIQIISNFKNDIITNTLGLTLGIILKCFKII